MPYANACVSSTSSFINVWIPCNYCLSFSYRGGQGMSCLVKRLLCRKHGSPFMRYARRVQLLVTNKVDEDIVRR